MRGVPPDLGRHLQQFRGSTLTEIGVGRYILHFRFDSVGAHRLLISVEGEWELLDPSGALLDGHQDARERETYRFHAVLGADVIGCEVASPDSFALRFSSGHQLRVFDRSREDESFSIQPGNVFV